MNIQAGLQAGANFLGAIVQTLPPFLSTMVSVAETAFPNAKSGLEKLNFVTGAAQTYLGTFGMQAATVLALVPLLEQTVNTIVAAAKAVPAALASDPNAQATPQATPVAANG